ncbi:MAG: Na+/H+ antiporter subunit E [Selenomonadaceae bacterium]
MINTDVLHDKSIVGSPIAHLSSMTIMLYVFWLLLSGNTQPKFLIYGAITSIVASWVCYPLLLIPNFDGTKKYFVFGINPFKIVYYFFWLMWQLILANIDVIKATVRHELDINPCVVKFRYRIDNPMGTVILANSITLTPGTVTMNVTPDGLYEVHALTDGAADGLKDPSGMPGKVAWLLGQDFEFDVVEVDY